MTDSKERIDWRQKYKVRANVLQDGYVDPITGPRCIIKPIEGEHNGLYLIAHTHDVLKGGVPVIYDYITGRASPLPADNGRPE